MPKVFLQAGAFLASAIVATATPPWTTHRKDVGTLWERPVEAPKQDNQANSVSGSSAASPVAPAFKKAPDGSWQISFAELAAFKLPPRTEGSGAAIGSIDYIPNAIRSLHRQRVRVTGYMLPIKLEKGRATEFLLLRNQMMCCYGIAPAANEWIVVRMKGEGVEPVMDVPLTLTGTLRVGEIYEDGTFVGIYRIDGEKISAQ